MHNHEVSPKTRKKYKEFVHLKEDKEKTPRKIYKPAFSRRKQPNLQGFKEQNVFLRAFDADEARETFVRLCRKHLMVDHLDNVFITTHLANASCTIFLLGEMHGKHTKCKEILDMFQELVAENKSLQKPLILDLMLEMIQYDKTKKTFGSSQLNRVRQYFFDCIFNRDCAMRVHWADPSIYHERKTPGWLNEINKLTKPNLPWSAGAQENLQNDDDLAKLVLLNPYAAKEIERASKVNPAFTVQFALEQFYVIWDQLQDTFVEESWAERVFYLKRAVVDLYTAARIVKLNMKHVIFYGGYAHVDNLIQILTALDFAIIENSIKRGPCSPELPFSEKY